MNKKEFDFELKDTKTPDFVIKEYVGKISEWTKEMVVCDIMPYDGMTENYIKRNSWAVTAKVIEELGKDITVDIQNSLGELGDIDNKYEVFLTVKGLEHYKYRIMFIRYGAISYPVTVVLNEDIAEAYSGKSQYEYIVGSMAELEEMLENIFETDYCMSLIQNLIYEALRQERKNSQ